MNKWYRILLRNSEALRRCIGWSKRTSCPGFQGVTLYDTAVFLINEAQRNDITFRSYAIAFTFFISLFPSILVVFTLVPYLPIYELIDSTVESYLYEVFPSYMAKISFDLIHDIGTRERGGLLSLSFILSFYFSSNGMMAMMRSFEKNYACTYRKRRVFKKRIVAIILTLSFGLILIGSVLLIVVGTQALDWVQNAYDLGHGYEIGLHGLQWLAIISFIYTGITITYRYGAATFERFRFFSPGATLASFLSILTSVGFAVYIDNFDSYNKLYGSIGTIIVFMLWLQLNVLWILIGYELNAGIAVSRDLKLARPDTEAD